MSPSTALKQIGEVCVTVFSIITKLEREIAEVDSVVFAAGGAAEDGLYRGLKGKVEVLYAAGDCVAPRGVEQAVYEGHKIGRAI